MKERRGKFLLALALLMTCAAAGTVAQYQTELGDGFCRDCTF
ncbi:MAG: hypothetical protein ACLT6Z_03530 [Coprobacillus cateniformis]